MVRIRKECLLRNHQGSLHLPILVLILTLTFGGFGTWGFLRHWRLLVEIQLRLDQCVGLKAKALRNTLNSLASTNRKIHSLRTAIQWNPDPRLTPLLQAALVFAAGQQEASKLQWTLQQGQWLLARGCGKRGDSAFALPPLQLTRPAPDWIGPQPLQWPRTVPKTFHVQANHPPRYAAAQVANADPPPRDLQEPQKESLHVVENSDFDQNHWIALWTSPKRPSGSGFD